MYAAGDVRVEEVPDARLVDATDALVTVTSSAICGSDLWPYKQMDPTPGGRRMGHEFIGVVEEAGTEVQTVKKGDLVVAPFVWSDGTCVFCREGLHTSCLHGGRYGMDGVDGGQGEAVRVPQADGTLVPLPVDQDDALMPSLLTLSDVMSTGHHAALSAEVGPGKTVAIIGDGAVGLCGVIASKRLGAERIIMLGHHEDRIALAKEFGATDIVEERGDEAVERVKELTDGLGAHSVLECVGHEESTVTAHADRARRRRDRTHRRAAGGSRSPRARARSSTTSRSQAARHPPARTSRSSSRTSSKAGSSPVACSTASARSTTCPTATGR